MVARQEKIFIVEDDKFLSKIIGNTLRKGGFEVDQAAEGGEGLRRILGEKPDLVLLDIMLPQKDGFEILAEMQRDSNASKIPVIIISNLGQESDVKRGLSLGAKDYVIKTDINLTELMRKVREQLVRKSKDIAK